MTFVDPIPLLIDYLDTDSTVDVVADLPVPLPDRFLQIRRIGGNVVAPVREQVLVDLRAWGDSPSDSMSILLAARAVAWQLVGDSSFGVTVYQLGETVGPRQSNDPSTSRPYAWLTLALTIRADAIVPYN